MIKKIVFCFLIVVFILSGCSTTDYVEPENRTVVTAMLINYSENSFVLTLETVNSQQGGNGEEYFAEYVTGTGIDLISAFNSAQSELSSQLSLFHCSLLICGSNTYLSKQEEIFNYILNTPQISLAANLILSENTDTFINYENNNIFLGYEITDMLKLNDINANIIEVLRGRVKPPLVTVDLQNKFTVLVN